MFIAVLVLPECNSQSAQIQRYFDCRSELNIRSSCAIINQISQGIQGFPKDQSNSKAPKIWKSDFVWTPPKKEENKYHLPMFWLFFCLVEVQEPAITKRKTPSETVEHQYPDPFDPPVRPYASHYLGRIKRECFIKKFGLKKGDLCGRSIESLARGWYHHLVGGFNPFEKS